MVDRNKQVNTEITETEILVLFTKSEPIIPNQNSQYNRFTNIGINFVFKKWLQCMKFLTFWPAKF